jgi:hypothetical protein
MIKAITIEKIMEKTCNLTQKAFSIADFRELKDLD